MLTSGTFEAKDDEQELVVGGKPQPYIHVARVKVTRCLRGLVAGAIDVIASVRGLRVIGVRTVPVVHVAVIP